jgi:hypothetical protein
MAGKIAYIIQGKHRPDFKPNIATNNEICVVVNASDPYVTGRTRYRKVYSRHSGIAFYFLIILRISWRLEADKNEGINFKRSNQVGIKNSKFWLLV